MPSAKLCPVNSQSRQFQAGLVRQANKLSADSLCAGSVTSQWRISIQDFPAVPPPQKGAIPAAILLQGSTRAHAAELDVRLRA